MYEICEHEGNKSHLLITQWLIFAGLNFADVFFLLELIFADQVPSTIPSNFKYRIIKVSFTVLLCPCSIQYCASWRLISATRPPRTNVMAVTPHSLEAVVSIFDSLLFIFLLSAVDPRAAHLKYVDLFAFVVDDGSIHSIGSYLDVMHKRAHSDMLKCHPTPSRVHHHHHYHHYLHRPHLYTHHFLLVCLCAPLTLILSDPWVTNTVGTNLIFHVRCPRSP